MLGRGYFAAGQMKAAIDAYAQVRRLDPERADYQEFEAQALSRLGPRGPKAPTRQSEAPPKKWGRPWPHGTDSSSNEQLSSG